jgi:hypothetical protein
MPFLLNSVNYSTYIILYGPLCLLISEQQEQLRVLHEKFKEEVNQQLLDCKNSLSNFEAYHTELKGVADKQSKFKFNLYT